MVESPTGVEAAGVDVGSGAGVGVCSGVLVGELGSGAGAIAGLEVQGLEVKLKLVQQGNSVVQL